MKKAVTLAALLLATPLFALDDTPQNRVREADRYIAATPPKEMFADMAEQMAKTLPADQRAPLKEALTKHLDVDALTKTLRDAMVKHFTADELKALADFYGSPVGKSAMKKLGVYTADVMPAVQEEMKKALAKATRDIPGAGAPTGRSRDLIATPK
jgi:hypothetical protein